MSSEARGHATDSVSAGPGESPSVSDPEQAGVEGRPGALVAQPAERARDRLPLFRAEALAAHSDLRLGQPIALVPLSWTVLTACLALFICAIAAFLLTATYTRKETARGVLYAVGGDVRVTAKSRGVVRELAVTEGEGVAHGARLAFISTTQRLDSGASADEEMLAALAREERILNERLVRLEASARYDEAALEAQISATLVERQAATALHLTSAKRLRIAQERLAQVRKLTDENFISADELRLREDAVLAHLQTEEDAQARQRALTARLAELQARRAQRPHIAAQERDQVMAQLASLSQRRAQIQAGQGYALHAPIAGRVSALQAVVGQSVDPQHPLMTITPQGAWLAAELYVPSRAIGFVRRGQRVRLLYDAFPYERFGPASGVVEAISMSVLSPREVRAAVQVNEPVYRIIVRPERQTMDLFGRAAPLMPGMALSADIILEQRTFAQWLLAPLFAIRDRL